jgi:cell division protein FtsQ
VQPVNQDKVRSASLEDGGAQTIGKGKDQSSWFSIVEAHADHAARIGFLVSMIFLAATAFYGLHLSGATAAIFDEVAAMSDRAAYDAGFRVEDLTFSGSKNTPRESLLKALGLPYANSSLSYDTAEAQDRLMKLGWVASAEVRRILPSRLEVLVSEREPFARWADAENIVQAIDREGHILGPAQGRFEALLLFGGEGAPAEAAEVADALSGHESVKRRVERLDLVAERFWQVKLDNGLVLKLPRKVSELVLGKVETLLSSSKIADMALDTIDLRLMNRTILQLREPTLANRERAVATITSGPAQPALPPRRGRAL